MNGDWQNAPAGRGGDIFPEDETYDATDLNSTSGEAEGRGQQSEILNSEDQP